MSSDTAERCGVGGRHATIIKKITTLFRCLATTEKGERNGCNYVEENGISQSKTLLRIQGKVIKVMKRGVIGEVGVPVHAARLCDFLLVHVPNLSPLASVFFRVSPRKHIKCEESPKYG